MTRTPLSRSKGHRSRSPGRFTQWHQCGLYAYGTAAAAISDQRGKPLLRCGVLGGVRRSAALRRPQREERGGAYRGGRPLTACYLRQGAYVFISVNWFVRLLYCAKTTQPIFTKFGGKVAHVPQVANLYRITLGLGIGYGYGLVGATTILRIGGYVLSDVCLNSNNFMTSAALAEQCALLSVPLVRTKLDFLYLFRISALQS